MVGTAKTATQLYSEIDTQLPTNNRGAITAAIMRGVLDDMVASSLPPTGNPIYTFDSRTSAVSSSISSSITSIQTSGYNTSGDGGGAQYIHASGSTPGGFQSADGQWWQIANNLALNVKQFGAQGDGVTDDTAAITTAISALTNGGVLSFPSATYLCGSSIVNGTTMPYGIAFIGLAGHSRIDTATGAVTIKYTGTGICWNIQEALGTLSIGGWQWININFTTTQGAGTMFALNDVTQTPTNDATSQNFIVNCSWIGCKFWGAGAGASQTGNALQASKLFASRIDSGCMFTGWKRAVYFHGCDNNQISADFAQDGAGNVRHIQLDGLNTFGNATLIDSRFFGGVVTNGPETGYGIYDNGCKATNIVAPYFENSCPASLYLNGTDTTVESPFFGGLPGASGPNNVYVRMGANMIMNTILNPNTTGATTYVFADDGATSYVWDQNNVNYGLLLINPAERLQQNVSLLFPRVRQIGACYVNGPRNYDPRLNMQSGGPSGLISPVRAATALTPEMLQSGAGGLASWSPVVDANARDGYAIQLSTTNLSGVLLPIVIGKDAQVGNTVIVEVRYRTVGTRSTGTTRATFLKNGANIANYALTDNSSFTVLRDIQDLSGFANSDVFQFGVYNANSDIPANIEYLQLFVIDKNGVSDLDAGISPDQGNSSISIYPNYGVDGRPYSTFKFDTALTAGRTVTLRTGYSTATRTLRILRTANANGGFNLDIGTGPLVSLTAAKQWADIAYDGSAWQLVGYGTLP